MKNSRSSFVALLFGLVGLVGAAALHAGCGSDPAPSAFPTLPADASVGSDAGTGESDGSLTLTTDAGDTTFHVVPAAPVLDVSAAGTTLQFHAMQGSAEVDAHWTLDVANAGAIDAHGLFTASALVGGPIGVTATSGTNTAFVPLTIHLKLKENPGNVVAATQAQLVAGGSADPGFAWLYPYDGTVFPRDLAPPVLQLTGSFDAARVHVSYGSLDYEAFFGASAPARIAIPAAAWKAITYSALGTDAVKVDVTKIAGGQVTGPVTHTWTIAPGSLRGSVYYDSYNSKLAGDTGAVLRVRPGVSTMPDVVIATNPNGECHVCHAVSADGTTMVASNERIDSAAGFTPTDGVYDLTKGAAKLYDAPNRTWDFGALSPDGSRFLRYGAVADANTQGLPWAPNVRGLGQSGDLPSELYDAKTGAKLAASGLDGASLHMMMPVFSPDGKMVAFNHYDAGLGKSVAVMDFDAKTNAFTNLRDVATLPSGFAGWPTFTPDGKWILFAGGTNPEYDTLSDDPSTVAEPTSDIWIAHVPSKTTVAADVLNGVKSGKIYLPYGEAAEGHLNFEPTILPVSAGGYFWVVFTSRREYGNTLTEANAYAPSGTPGPRKKLWVAAVDIDPAETPSTAAHDITHPAFYLDGQELAAGNMRGFWSLDPCKQNGNTCDTGGDCCSGFCRQTAGSDGGAVFACVPPSGCAKDGERCATSADCCDVSTGTQCIAGYCGKPGPK